MGRQIIRQPDGRLAVWSTVVDDWIIRDAEADELVEHFANEAAEKVRRDTTAEIADVLAGQAQKRYYQFTMTFEEAEDRREQMHGQRWRSATTDETEPLT